MVDGREVDLDTELHEGDQVAIITAESDAGREVLRHSTAHVIAQAVRRYGRGHDAIGPVMENSFCLRTSSCPAGCASRRKMSSGWTPR